MSRSYRYCCTNIHAPHACAHRSAAACTLCTAHPTPAVHLPLHSASPRRCQHRLRAPPVQHQQPATATGARFPTALAPTATPQRAPWQSQSPHTYTWPDPEDARELPLRPGATLGSAPANTTPQAFPHRPPRPHSTAPRRPPATQSSLHRGILQPSLALEDTAATAPAAASSLPAEQCRMQQHGQHGSATRHERGSAQPSGSGSGGSTPPPWLRAARRQGCAVRLELCHRILRPAALKLHGGGATLTASSAPHVVKLLRVWQA